MKKKPTLKNDMTQNQSKDFITVNQKFSILEAKVITKNDQGQCNIEMSRKKKTKK